MNFRRRISLMKRLSLYMLLSALTSYGTSVHAGACRDFLSELFGIEGLGRAIDYGRYKAGINNVYRGVAGPLLLQKRDKVYPPSLTGKIQDKLSQYRRRETDRGYISEVDVLSFLMSQAERGYSSIWAREANFSIIYQFSRSWAETAHESRAFNRYSVYGMGFISELKDIGFLLRVAPPKDTRYWEDRVGAIEAGIMTRLNAREVIPYEQRGKFIFKVRYKDEWQNPEPIRHIWEPLNEFSQETVEMMFDHPDGTVEDWVMEMRQIYRRIFGKEPYQK